MQSIEFHISQVDGVKPFPKNELHDIEPIEKAESILHGYWTKENITVEHVASDRAYYSPSLDMIHLPLFEQFTDTRAGTEGRDNFPAPVYPKKMSM